MSKKTNFKEVSVEEFIDAIRKLPSDQAQGRWIRWLSEYDEPGFYNRLPGMNRSAKFAYNHIANPGMLLWLIQAAGVEKHLVDLATVDSNKVKSKNAKTGAIRKRVPWETLERALWGSGK
jgi:hypothetical protein